MATISRMLLLAALTALVTVPGVKTAASAEFERRPTVVRVLEIEGVINPLTARYLERGIDEPGADLVIVRLDTPGGLESSMREMVQQMLSSSVPVAK